MKTWNVPELQELDVKLTAKRPGCIEQEGKYIGGYFYCPTYNAES